MGHASKASSSIVNDDVLPSGENVIEDKLVHPLKAPFLIFVTVEGIVIEVNAVHPLKHSIPILVIPLGKSICVSFLQFLNV
jgi:hypothetical protein